MRVLEKLLLLWFCVTSVISEFRDGKGVLRTFYGLGINPGERPAHITSFGYPNEAPKDVEQRWKFITFAESTALKLDCIHIDIPKLESCGDYVFKFNEKQYCGDVAPFTLTLEANDVTFTFKSGPKGGGRVNCTVQSVYTNSLEDFDSSEHGVSPGLKETTCPCGWSNKGPVSRILNGNEAVRNEYPYMTMLIETKNLQEFCGGAIISPWHVLSTATCTISKTENCVPISVIVGQHNIYDLDKTPGWQMIDAEKVVEHPGYSKTNFLNDISIIFLKSQIVFSARVGPVCLPNGPMNYENNILKITGWGAKQPGGTLSETVQKVNMKVLKTSDCFNKYPFIKSEPPMHLCTSAKDKALCDGDGGNPAVWLDPQTNRLTLAGLASFGMDCRGDKPSVHTKVDSYLDWIRNQIAATKSVEVCTKRM